MNQKKQITNGISLDNCHEQETAAYLARKKLGFLFNDLLTDVSVFAKVIENKIDTDLNTLKTTLTVRGLIKTFPKTTVGLALASGFLIGKSTNNDQSTNSTYSLTDKSKSDDLLNEIKAIGFTFLTRYVVNLLSDTLDSNNRRTTPRSDPH